MPDLVQQSEPSDVVLLVAGADLHERLAWREPSCGTVEPRACLVMGPEVILVDDIVAWFAADVGNPPLSRWVVSATLAVCPR